MCLLFFCLPFVGCNALDARECVWQCDRRITGNNKKQRDTNKRNYVNSDVFHLNFDGLFGAKHSSSFRVNFRCCFAPLSLSFSVSFCFRKCAQWQLVLKFCHFHAAHAPIHGWCCCCIFLVWLVAIDSSCHFFLIWGHSHTFYDSLPSLWLICFMFGQQNII